MKPSTRNLKDLVPERVKGPLRRAYQTRVFDRAMKQYLRDPEVCAHPEHPVLQDLVYGWGNPGWSAWTDYLAACMRHIMTSKGAILECGSGLTTIVVGVLARRMGVEHWVLEHDARWAGKVSSVLSEYKLDEVRLVTKPLKDYGEFVWYDPPMEMLPDAIRVVVCDGPPSRTRGGRYGLVPVTKSRMQKGCTILLDDAGRVNEQDIAELWQHELDATIVNADTMKPYMIITVPPQPHRSV